VRLAGPIEAGFDLFAQTGATGFDPGAPSSYGLDPETRIDVPQELLPGNVDSHGLIAFYVQGDSMRDAMLQDGDYVVLQPAEHWNNGDTMAVSLLETGEVTLKRMFQRDRGVIELRPVHTGQESRYHTAAEIKVVGKLLAVLRRCW